MSSTVKAYKIYGTSYQTNIFLIGPNACGPFSTKTAPLDTEINKRLGNVTRKETSSPSLLLVVGDYGWVNQWDPGYSYPTVTRKEQAEWHGQEDSHNLAFLDGHVKFLKIRKGIYVAEDYKILPFKELDSLAYTVQDANQ